MKKIVNGVEVLLTQAEIDEFNQRQASWDASEAERVLAEKQEAFAGDPELPTLDAKIDALLAAVSSPEIDAINTKIQQLKTKHGL